MTWKDLLQPEDATVTLPWAGGRRLLSRHRSYRIQGKLPAEHGWYCWTIHGRNVYASEQSRDPMPELLTAIVRGYLVGDHLVLDDVPVDPDPAKLVTFSERVLGIPEGLDRFIRVQAGRIAPEGPLHFIGEDFPLGPEEAVLEAFLDKAETVADIPEVTPALDVAFRMENYQREQAELRRLELERLRQEEAARLVREDARRRLRERLGDGALRREVAKTDFATAARTALLVGGAEFLDHRRAQRPGEWVVKYRVDGRRLECVCSTNLRIIDAGVCLNDYETGEKGDQLFTLESLPDVIREAVDRNVLVVWRNV